VPSLWNIAILANFGYNYVLVLVFRALSNFGILKQVNLIHKRWIKYKYVIKYKFHNPFKNLSKAKNIKHQNVYSSIFDKDL